MGLLFQRMYNDMTKLAVPKLTTANDRRSVSYGGARRSHVPRKRAARSRARQPLELASFAEVPAGDWNLQNVLDPDFDEFDGDFLGQIGIALFDDDN